MTKFSRRATFKAAALGTIATGVLPASAQDDRAITEAFENWKRLKAVQDQVGRTMEIAAAAAEAATPPMPEELKAAIVCDFGTRKPEYQAWTEVELTDLIENHYLPADKLREVTDLLERRKAWDLAREAAHADYDRAEDDFDTAVDDNWENIRELIALPATTRAGLALKIHVLRAENVMSGGCQGDATLGGSALLDDIERLL